MIVKANRIKSCLFKMLSVLKIIGSEIEVIIIIIEAKAWIKKYLIEASVDFQLSLDRIRGIILIKLISNPSQAVNQEPEEIAINEPIVKKVKKIIV